MATSDLQKLLTQRAQLEERINRARSRAAAEEKKRDIRRKIIAGTHLINLARGDLQRIGRELKNAGALEQREYELFGLPPD